MTEVIRYTQLGKEDIRFGTGTFEVVLADGRKVILNEVDLAAILSDTSLSSTFLGQVTILTSDSMDERNAKITQAGVGGAVYFEKGTHLITSQLTMLASQSWIGIGRYSSILQKAFNGDLIQAASFTRLTGLSLLGDGSNFTGRGVLYGTSMPLCTIDQCAIKDFQDYCVEFTAPQAGSQFTMVNCEVYQTTQTNSAIKLPDDGVSATPRKFFAVETSGGNLIDLNGCQNTIIEGCFINTLTFNDNAKKVILCGNRIASGGTTIDVKGTEHVIADNVVASTLNLTSGTTRCIVRQNVIASTFNVTDNSGSIGDNANYVDTSWASFTTVWTGASVNPSIGNGTLESRYVRYGKSITIHIRAVMGTTTTYGTGEWSFQLPLTAHNDSVRFVGSARLRDSGTAYFVGTVLLVGGSATLSIYPDNGSTAVSSVVPFAWTSGDELDLNLTYQVG